MITALFLSIALQSFIQTVNGMCSEEDFAKLYNCANMKTKSDYQQLREKKLDKVNTEKSRMQSCVTNAGCDVTIDYKTKWSDFIKPSPLDSTFALIQKFWDSQRVEMQQCELTRSMNPLNQLIADCVQKKIPDFKLPESMPEPAMPPADMMKSEFPLVQQYLENRISAIVQAKTCPTESRANAISCISDNEGKDIGKCVQANMCQSPSCSPHYNELRLALQSCFADVLLDPAKPFSVLEEVIELKAMETLTSCENKARAVAGNANFKFNRKEAKTIYEKDTQVIAGGLGPQFRQSIKSLMDAYVNTEAFLEVTCDPNKTKIH